MIPSSANTQPIRRLAIEEFGESARELSHATLMMLLEKKAKRENWSANRNAYVTYDPSVTRAKGRDQ